MKKLSTLRTIILTGLTLLPLTVFAQTSLDAARGIGTLAGLIEAVTQTVIKSMATLLLSLALLAFFYGIVEYIWAKRKGDASGVKNGGEFMKWGLLALFVMFSVYGIIKFAQSTLFGTTDMTTITIPNIQFGGKSGSAVVADPLGGAAATGNNGSPVNTTGSGVNYSGYPQYTTGSAVNTQTSLKSIGEYCSTSSDCLSNYCNRQGMCAVPAVTQDSMYTCPDGSKVPTSDAKFCPQAPVDAATYRCPDGSMVLPSDAKFCPQSAPSNVNVGDPCSINGSFGNIDANGNCSIN